ncbi:hypothetical protein [Nonomuraea angiospora]
MGTEVGSEHHHGSHRDLIEFHPRVARSGRVDAIVVPTIRHPVWLSHAIRLAIALDCPLVTLHSKWSKPDLLLMPAGLRFVSVDIDDLARLNLPDFATTALLKGTPFARATDLSAKRNMGLILARLMGWRRIVFLDDDIEVGGHEEVAHAAALLDSYDAVGMHIGGYPDNSVVCHAHKLTGGHQESFVGGGALAVETTRDPSFFPNIYNEDWFYLLGDRSVRPLAVTGMVKQRPYDPFDRPMRARDQELGDVLAEGVYWLLDGGEGTGWRAAADPAYWVGALARRGDFVKDVLRRVRELPPDAATSRRAMEESLLAALGRLNRITPQFCVKYLEAWAADRDRWADHFARIPQLGPYVADAMKWLVKPGAPPLRQWTSFDS